MKVSFEDWKNNWLNFGSCSNGKVEIKQTPSIGSGIEFYYGTIQVENLHHLILISQNVNKVDYHNASMSFLTFECNLKNNAGLKIHLNRTVFFDRIFYSRRIKTGNEKFDRKYMISSTNPLLAKNIFTDKKCQKMIVSNKSLVFNISNIKGLTVLKMKYMQNKLYSIEEMQKALDDFNHILNLLNGNASNR